MAKVGGVEVPEPIAIRNELKHMSRNVVEASLKGARIARYLWFECNLSKLLVPKGVTYRQFERFVGSLDVFVKWFDGDLTWEDAIKRFSEELSKRFRLRL